MEIHRNKYWMVNVDLLFVTFINKKVLLSPSPPVLPSQPSFICLAVLNWHFCSGALLTSFLWFILFDSLDKTKSEISTVEHLRGLQNGFSSYFLYDSWAEKDCEAHSFKSRFIKKNISCKCSLGIQGKQSLIFMHVRSPQTQLCHWKLNCVHAFSTCRRIRPIKYVNCTAILPDKEYLFLV